MGKRTEINIPDIHPCINRFIPMWNGIAICCKFLPDYRTRHRHIPRKNLPSKCQRLVEAHVNVLGECVLLCALAGCKGGDELSWKRDRCDLSNASGATNLVMCGLHLSTRQER